MKPARSIVGIMLALCLSPPLFASDTAQFLLAQQITPGFIASSSLPGQRPWIRVDIRSQQLHLYDAAGIEVASYPVSSSKYGIGGQEGSYKTPQGWHVVCDKIGDGATRTTIIYHRQVTPWHYSSTLHRQYPERDWVLARILWLCGLEPGVNQGGQVDSHDRAIYIHGAGDHVIFGQPGSQGRIRMRGEDVIDLYRRTAIGTPVLIDPDH